MEKIEWYEKVEKAINNDLEGFYSEFYGVHKLLKIGTDSFRVNPCPVCGHNDGCTLTGNTVHCFCGGCGWKGTHITAWMSYCEDKLRQTNHMAVERLEKFSGYKFPHGTPEEMAEYEKYQKIQKIRKVAQQFYNDELFRCVQKFEYKEKMYTPLEYLTKVRKRKESTLKAFSVGFSNNYKELSRQLQELGFTQEEIKNAKIWAPEGVFVYPYTHPTSGDIVRINTKNPFKVCFYGKKEVVKGYSIGSKFLYFSPEFDFKKNYAVIVEGENDIQALWESGEKQVVAAGGTIEKEGQLAPLYRMSESTTYYAMYDNDKAGDAYVEMTNEYFADRPVSLIKYDLNYNDPDEYYTYCENPKSVQELIQEAEPLTTDKFKIRREKGVWSIATRNIRLEFTIKNKQKSGQFSGTAIYYSNGKLIDRQDDIPLVKCRASVKPLNFYLLDAMEEYFNSNIEKKSVEELLSIYTLSAKKGEIIHQIAQVLFEKKTDDDLVNSIKISAKKHIFNDADDVIDEIFKELNQIQIRNAGSDLSNIPKMRVGQYFNVTNNDAYMYFTYVKVDGETKRKLPFLLRNDGTLIRLDLLKKKDTQCILLVDNKYELMCEINDAILDLNECSLTQDWVEKFAAGELTEEELSPARLIRDIERYIRLFYYADSECVYKVLALYIYMTYFYELFGQVPYLYLNGKKGSGKSILDATIKLLAFNAKMALDITEAALFRILTIEGGVLIMDEQENLTAKNSRTTDNGMAAVLKGGYVRSGAVYRANTDNNGTEKYIVYGPKVISNINGMDDVIEDRCLTITSYPLKLTKETKLEDPKYYEEEKLGEIKGVTSRCALSALTHFKTLYSIYRDNLFETGNARLTQILTPIMAVAKLVDLEEVKAVTNNNSDIQTHVGEYEKALMEYWETKLKTAKENTEKDTPEGIIKKAVSTIAKELYGQIPQNEIEFTNPANHKYTEPIKFNKEEGWFEVNVVHFKCFIEEIKPGDTVYPRYILRYLNTVFNFGTKDVKRRITSIENEALQKEFNSNAKPKVNYYRFYFRDFINLDDSFMKEQKTQYKKDEDLF